MRKKIRTHRRRRRDEPAGGIGTLTQTEVWSLTLGTDGFSDDGERRRAYERHRDELIESINLGTRPAAFWDYEPGVPAALRRCTRDDLQVAAHQRAAVRAAGTQDYARHRWLFEDEAVANVIAAEGALEARRLRWLLAGGQDNLRPGETTVIIEQLRALEAEPCSRSL